MEEFVKTQTSVRILLDLGIAWSVVLLLFVLPVIWVIIFEMENARSVKKIVKSVEMALNANSANLATSSILRLNNVHLAEKIRTTTSSATLVLA